jgi:hypothetical protein
VTLPWDEVAINAFIGFVKAVIFFLSPVLTTLIGVTLAASIVVLGRIFKKKSFRLRSLEERAPKQVLLNGRNWKLEDDLNYQLISDSTHQ